MLKLTHISNYREIEIEMVQHLRGEHIGQKRVVVRYQGQGLDELGLCVAVVGKGWCGRG